MSDDELGEYVLDRDWQAVVRERDEARAVATQLADAGERLAQAVQWTQIVGGRKAGKSELAEAWEQMRAALAVFDAKEKA